MSEQSSDVNRRRRGLLLAALALALLIGVVGWLLGRKPKIEVAATASEPAEAAQAPAAPLATQRPATAPAPPSKPKPRPLEYMSDGVPIMPASPNDEQPNTFAHPHPITSAHLRIFRENNLLYQLNEAMDGRESVRLRALLAVYREEYPDDPHEMQQGYELIADCIDNPSDAVRVRAQRYFNEEIASTLRRFVKRHCLDSSP